MSFSARVAWAVLASLLVHGACAFILTLLAAPPVTPDCVQVDLVVDTKAPTSDASRTAARPLPEPTGIPEVLPGGPHSPGTLDKSQPSGRGGQKGSREAGAFLFAFQASLTLQDTDLNNLQANQAQRIRTARDRATQEERRSSPNAALAAYLASGGEKGHAERRPARRRDAASGAPESDKEASARGSEPRETSLVPLTPPPSQEPIGAEREEVGRGILKGRGDHNTRAAKVIFARPNVDLGPAATTADEKSARVRDDIDAELLAAQLQRSLVDSSVQGGQPGSGSGGSQAAGPGLTDQGRGLGAQALPFLPGQGRLGALDTSDARYLRWFTSQKARVQHELVFPRERALAKDQGTSILRVEVRRDGSLRSAPTLIRSSGFSEFDNAALRAIQRAAPFEPLPAALAPELDRLSLIIPVAFANPMVQ